MKDFIFYMSVVFTSFFLGAWMGEHVGMQKVASGQYYCTEMYDEVYYCRERRTKTAR